MQFIIVSWKFLINLNILIVLRSSVIDILKIEGFANLSTEFVSLVLEFRGTQLGKIINTKH